MTSGPPLPRPARRELLLGGIEALFATGLASARDGTVPLRGERGASITDPPLPFVAPEALWLDIDGRLARLEQDAKIGGEVSAFLRRSSQAAAQRGARGVERAEVLEDR